MGMFGDPDRYNSTLKLIDEPNNEYKPEEQQDVDILRKRYDEFILYSDTPLKGELAKFPENWEFEI